MMSEKPTTRSGRIVRPPNLDGGTEANLMEVSKKPSLETKDNLASRGKKSSSRLTKVKNVEQREKKGNTDVSNFEKAVITQPREDDEELLPHSPKKRATRGQVAEDATEKNVAECRPKRQTRAATKGDKKAEKEPKTVAQLRTTKRSKRVGNNVNPPAEDLEVILPASPQKQPSKRIRKKPEVACSPGDDKKEKLARKKALNSDEIAKLLLDEADNLESERPRAKKGKQANKSTGLDGSEGDDEISFNMTRSERSLQKKVPIYMQKTTPVDKVECAKPTRKKADDDPYDEIFLSSDEKTSKDAKKAKKTIAKKRKPRKQKANIILTFGSSKKNAVVPVLKQMKNLETSNDYANKAPAPSCQKESMQVPSVSSRKLSGPNSLSLTWTPKQPSMRAPKSHERTTSSPRDQIEANSVSPRNFPTASTYQNIDPSCTPGNEEHAQDVFEADEIPSVDPKRYTTPVVAKHISKFMQDRKASTPRLEDASKSHPPPSKEELLKKCFGFEDSSESEANENESLIGFSPVVKVPNTISKNQHLLLSPTRSSMTNMTRISSSTSIANPTTPSMISSTVEAPLKTDKPFRLEFKMPVPKPVNPLYRSKYSVNKICKPISSLDSSSKSDSKMEVSLFNDILSAENEENPETLEQIEHHQDMTGEEASKVVECVEKEGVAGANKVNNKDKKRPLKTVTNITKAKKQTLIYEHVEGGKKQVKATRKKAAPLSSGSDENVEADSPKKRACNVSKTYTKAPLNTSVTTSPIKKGTKKSRELDRWASLQTSHFSEIEDFDLSFN